MQKTQKSMKTMSRQRFTQFELTTKLLQNLYKFKLTSTAKLVLMYLSSCYNPKHAEMFPKQRTIADKIGVSEASVIRAISELHKEGLIISERKYTNRYKYTSKFLISLGISDNKMHVDNSQNKIIETCKMTPACIKQINKTNKTTNVENFKILKDYAKTRAKNIPAYINYLKANGFDKQIIADYKQAQKKAKQMKESIQENIKALEYARENRVQVPENYFKDIRKLITG